MRADQMPRLVEGCAPAGMLRQSLAAAWGIDRPVTVAGGAGDNAAAACGIGAMSEGQAFVSLGTSGVLLAARDGYHPAPETAVHTFCHAVPDRWYQMGVMLSATDSLNWLSRLTGTRPADLTAQLGGQLAAPGEVRFLPYLSGERTPHNDPIIRSGITGIGAQTDQRAMTQAVLEGVTFGLRDMFDALRQTGAAPTRLIAIGGGTASPYWLRLIATVLDVPLALPEGSEFGAALGAARLGLVAATGRPVEEVMTPPHIASEIAPEDEHRAAFEEAFLRFRDAYPLIRAAQ